MNDEQKKRFEELKKKKAEREAGKKSEASPAQEFRPKEGAAQPHNIINVCFQFDNGSLNLPFHELSKANAFLYSLYDVWAEGVLEKIIHELGSGETVAVDLSKVNAIYTWFEE